MVDPSERRTYWNERYDYKGLVFGSEANVFVGRHLSGWSPRRVLDLGCGQGRNSIWLALRGHDVTGVDLSDVAIGHAADLAATAGVDIEFIAADLVTWQPEADAFDLVLLSYLQLEEDRRKVVHASAVRALAPGGTLFLVAHHRDNLEHGYGGPQRPEVLFGEQDVALDFAGLEVARNEKVERLVERDDDPAVALDLLFIATRRAS
ncbi:MAG: class I SAM-dependent methyltransferase [Acidimicrobiia bacterium]